jgi:hypothetical protein
MADANAADGKFQACKGAFEKSAAQQRALAEKLERIAK